MIVISDYKMEIHDLIGNFILHLHYVHVNNL